MISVLLGKDDDSKAFTYTLSIMDMVYLTKGNPIVLALGRTSATHLNYPEFISLAMHDQLANLSSMRMFIYRYYPFDLLIAALLKQKSFFSFSRTALLSIKNTPNQIENTAAVLPFNMAVLFSSMVWLRQ